MVRIPGRGSAPATTADTPASTSSGSTPETTPAQSLEHACTTLRRYGYSSIADFAEQKASDQHQTRAVVVVGEVGRGKSLLVNALTRQPGLSPVGPELTTTAAIHLIPESRKHAGAKVNLIAGDQSWQVPRSELRDWVSVHGSKVADPKTEILPTRVLVPVADNPLGDVTVIDTPGTGGLDPAHASLASASAQLACVLVITADASAPLTQPEMAFIRDATMTVENVIVALTKTDKNLRRWQLIADENRTLLRTHLKRDIPVIGVSSLRASTAASYNPAQRNAEEAASGVTELRAAIIDRLTSGTHASMIDALRTAREGLRLVDTLIRQDAQALKNTTTALPGLHKDREELELLKKQSQQWEAFLGRDLNLARTVASTHLDQQLDQVRTAWTARIQKRSLEVLRRNPQKFATEIERDLHTAVGSTLTVFSQELRRILLPLFGNAVLCEHIEASISQTLSTQSTSGHTVGKKTQDLLDPSLLTIGVIGTTMLGAITGFGLVAGAAWISVNLGYKAMRTGKQNLLTWLRETIMTTRTHATRTLDSALSVARPEIVLRYRDYLKDRSDAVQRQIREVEAAAKQDQQKREESLTRLARNHRIVTSQADALEQHITTLSS
ncbi:dynamin family protein [Hoyosella rhizosphaerae]|uniref:Dynamin n=1 Tax=Hoyosella rhizosphaerae TaxID=1755582 RepID=A0A916UEV6_9ACTN|nr:dynamin family protein [Hoyosella rhizosphaerae]MBN4925547.1 dynamin family protein [Hoyosella rhizosphaerae]GGC69814.1 dynamin [Hoyosella rhizosphaerae]